MRFTRKGKHSGTPMPPPPLQTDTPLSKWCLSIYDTTLAKFEECLLNNNLSALIISGYPTQRQLYDAWENILAEYSEGLGNNEFILYRNMYREIEILKLNIEMVKICIAALRKNYSSKFCNELNRLLFVNCKFNVNDPKSYFAELDKCERRIGGLKMNLDLKLIEFVEVEKKVKNNDSGKKIDKNYFTSVLIIISRGLSLGYKLNKDIMLNEYLEYFRQCNEEGKKNQPKKYERY